MKGKLVANGWCVQIHRGGGGGVRGGRGGGGWGILGERQKKRLWGGQWGINLPYRKPDGEGNCLIPVAGNRAVCLSKKKRVGVYYP